MVEHRVARDLVAAYVEGALADLTVDVETNRCRGNIRAGARTALLRGAKQAVISAFEHGISVSYPAMGI